VHILVPGRWSVKRGHDLAERVEAELRTALLHATVFTHLLPPSRGPAQWNSTPGHYVRRVVAPEYLEGRAPFQEQVHVRALVFDFLSQYALMLLEWADRAEASANAWARLTAAERDRRALDSIRREFARFRADIACS